MDLERIHRRITDEFGLLPRHNWRQELSDAIVRVCSSNRLAPNELQQRIENDVSMLRELAGQLGIHESYFLRQPEHFECVIRHLTSRLKTWPEGRPFTIWSAGCARGEEPYTAAILLDARLGYHLRARANLLGTDVSRSAIESARAGVYTAWSFRGLPEWFPMHYFHAISDERRRVIGRIRDWVQFVPLDVSEHLRTIPPESIDVLLFRNVAVYLDARRVDELYRKFARALSTDGMLIVGPSDPLPTSELFASDRDSGVYRPRRALASRSGSFLHAVDSPCEPPRQDPPEHPQVPLLPVRNAKTGSAALVDTSEVDEALRLADQGKLDDAVAIATRLVERAPASKIGYQLRGRIRLAGLSKHDAVDDFRRAVFIDPCDLLGRYWYIVSLHAAGMASQCLGQVRELFRRARHIPADQVLEDQKTTAQELIIAIDVLVEKLS